MYGRIRDEHEENIMREQERFFSRRSHVDGNLHSKLILVSLVSLRDISPIKLSLYRCCF